MMDPVGMAYPHVVRLRGPWEYEPLARSVGVADSSVSASVQQALPPSGRVRMPADWGSALGADFRGCVRYRRRFNRPSGLEPHERVWLVLEGADGWGEVSLGGKPLGRLGGYSLAAGFDVTPLVEDRNELAVDVTLPHRDAAGEQPLRSGRAHLPGGLVGEVRLEIRTSHWIDDLSLEPAAGESGVTLSVRGRVSGPSESENLTLVVDGPTGEVLASDVTACSTFALTAAVKGLPDWPWASGRTPEVNVAVRLIGGAAAVWEKHFTVSQRPLEWNEAEQVLTVAGEALPLPVEPLQPNDTLDECRFAAEVAHLAGKAVGWDTMLPESFYGVLDGLGVRLLQGVRPEWAAEVCRPRAHHPSIVAWVAPRGALGPLQRIIGERGSGDRPWIAREAAFAE